jgi:hypothetical protein
MWVLCLDILARCPCGLAILLAEEPQSRHQAGVMAVGLIQRVNIKTYEKYKKYEILEQKA